MERGGINSYPRTIGMNPKPSKKTGIYNYLHKGLRKGVKMFFLWRWLRRKSKVFIYSVLSRFCNNAEIISIHVLCPFHTWVTCLRSFPGLCPDITTSSAFLGWLPVSHLHPKIFLPRNLLQWVLCLCNHGLTLQLLVFSIPPQCEWQRQVQAQLQEKVKVPWSWLVGKEQ